MTNSDVLLKKVVINNNPALEKKYDSKDLNKELETFIINNSPITLGKVFEFFCKRGYTKEQVTKALNNFNKNHMNFQSKEMEL